MKHPILAVLALALCAAPAMAQEAVNLESDAAKINYFIGINVAQSFKKLRVDMDETAFMRGVKDTLEGKTPAVDDAAMQAVLMAHQEKLQKEMMEEQAVIEAKRAEEIPANKEMIAAFSADPAIKSTDSGIKYRMQTEGAGTSPLSSDSVEVHYTGMLLDGTVFDSSYDRNETAKFGLGQVIKGWGEALQLMKPGGKIQVLIPADLAYGAQSPPGSNIPANSPLFFEIELISVQ